jgi:hypothetical protein
MPFSQHWWNAPMFWPQPDTMALSEHLLGLSLMATPLQFAGVSALAAYNVCLLLTYALCGFFAYLLAQRLTGSTAAAICTGVAFACSPYRASQLAHVQVLAAHWMPLVLLGLHAYVSTGHARWLALFAVAWLLQALSNGYYLLFLPVLIVAWLAWFVDWRRSPRRGLAIVGAWAIASLPLVPLLLKYRAVHEALGMRRTVPEIRQFSALPESFLHAPPLLRFWPEGPAPTYEQYLFPGATVVAVALIGLILVLSKIGRPAPAGRAPLIFYLFAAVLMGVLALGPGGEGMGPASPLRPYTWLLALPGYDGLRVSSRIMTLATLCLAIAAGLAVARVSFLPRLARIGATVMVLAGLAVDGLTEPVPILTPPGRALLPGSSQAAVIELPPDNTYVSVAAMYRSMFHRRPVVNGYSGHFPPHYNVLTLALWRGDTSPLLYLARRRPLVIMVNDVFDPGHGFRDMVELLPGIERHGISAAGPVYVLPAQPQGQQPPSGLPFPAQARDVGRYLIEYDLGTPRDLSVLEFPLRRRYVDLASRLRIEVSEDGAAWREAWAGWTGGLAVEATLADPELAPIRIGLPALRARYVRIYPASDWMKAEVTLH